MDWKNKLNIEYGILLGVCIMEKLKSEMYWNVILLLWVAEHGYINLTTTVTSVIVLFIINIVPQSAIL